jgi:peroxin-10
MKSSSIFPPATPADILRATQKDEYYLQFIRRTLSDNFKIYFGTRVHVQFASRLKYLAELLYFSLTTLTGSQTLGEEYSDILLVQKNRKLGWIRRLLGVLSYVFGAYLLRRLFSYAIDRAGSLC